MVVSAEESDSFIFINSEGLGDYWIAEKKVAPVYPERSLRKGEEGCVVVGYVIESDGTTSSHRAIVSSTSHFQPSAIRAAKQFIYSPSDKNLEREPVFTTNTFTYQMSRSKKGNERVQKALMDRCNEAANKSLNADTGDAGAG